jgi:hypothetical protein
LKQVKLSIELILNTITKWCFLNQIATTQEALINSAQNEKNGLYFGGVVGLGLTALSQTEIIEKKKMLRKLENEKHKF